MEPNMKVFAVFQGYLTHFREKNEQYDEWLCGLYLREIDAADNVEAFGGGKGWDDNRCLQITRYFGKPKSSFEPGDELETLVKGGEKRWVRYAPIPVSGS